MREFEVRDIEVDHDGQGGTLIYTHTKVRERKGCVNILMIGRGNVHLFIDLNQHHEFRRCGLFMSDSPKKNVNLQT